MPDLNKVLDGAGVAFLIGAGLAATAVSTIVVKSCVRQTDRVAEAAGSVADGRLDDAIEVVVGGGRGPGLDLAEKMDREQRDDLLKQVVPGLIEDAVGNKPIEQWDRNDYKRLYTLQDRLRMMSVSQLRDELANQKRHDFYQLERDRPPAVRPDLRRILDGLGDWTLHRGTVWVHESGEMFAYTPGAHDTPMFRGNSPADKALRHRWDESMKEVRPGVRVATSVEPPFSTWAYDGPIERIHIGLSLPDESQWSKVYDQPDPGASEAASETANGPTPGRADLRATLAAKRRIHGALRESSTAECQDLLQADNATQAAFDLIDSASPGDLVIIAGHSTLPHGASPTDRVIHLGGGPVRIAELHEHAARGPVRKRLIVVTCKAPDLKLKTNLYPKDIGSLVEYAIQTHQRGEVETYSEMLLALRVRRLADHLETSVLCVSAIASVPIGIRAGQEAHEVLVRMIQVETKTKPETEAEKDE
ncbi:MAG: hypothetical protein NCW75_09665 [Phycisphaera sp.]|nr:MAG: hypothetical protein NCW75_09665 [Phycisphaera sp.]